jgi:hypothetical protein
MDDRWLRAARDGCIVIVLTVAALSYQASRESAERLLPADVVLTAPVVPGTDQLQLLIRGAGCELPEDQQGHDYTSPHDRVKRTYTQFDDDARTITVTVKVAEPGKFACTGEDPGVPWTITLPAPVGDRKILDGTRNPPEPMRSGPPRTLSFGAVPTAHPTPSATPAR